MLAMIFLWRGRGSDEQLAESVLLGQENKNLGEALGDPKTPPRIAERGRGIGCLRAGGQQ